MNPAAKVEDLDHQPGEDEEANPVALRYEVCTPNRSHLQH